MRKQTKVFLSILSGSLVIIAAVICWNVYASTIYRAGGVVADQVGLKQESDELNAKALNLERKAAAEKAFGTDVVWVEISESDFEQAYRIIMDRMPIGRTFSYKRVASDKYGMYLSKGLLEKLSAEINTIEHR